MLFTLKSRPLTPAPGQSGHLLCGHHQGRRAHLPADLCRYVFEVGSSQALHDQDADYGCRHVERSGFALFCWSGHRDHSHPADRGTEFCGCPEAHDYQLYLALNDIEHTKTKVRHPQTNGIYERFHKTILQEFYQVAF